MSQAQPAPKQLNLKSLAMQAGSQIQWLSDAGRTDFSITSGITALRFVRTRNEADFDVRVKSSAFARLSRRRSTPKGRRSASDRSPSAG